MWWCMKIDFVNIFHVPSISNNEIWNRELAPVTASASWRIQILYMEKIFLLLLIFLVACSSQGPPTQIVEVTSTFTVQPSPSATFTTVPSATSTALPTIVPTNTSIPCD